MYNILLGTDPEVFASYPSDLNYARFVPAPFAMPPAGIAKYCGMPILGGPDKHPIYLEEKEYRVIGDGVAFELNFKKPFEHPLDMYYAVKKAKENLAEELKKYGFDLYEKPTINFDFRRFWNDEEMKDKKMYWATVFGCDPDTDAFEAAEGLLARVCPIIDVSGHPQRYAGHHFHFSNIGNAMENPLLMVRLFAVMMGNYCNANSNYPELDRERAKYYGKAGKFRLQEYPNGMKGIEYRTPSSSVLSYTEDQYMKMFDLAFKAVALLNEKVKRAVELVESFGYQTTEAIAQADANASKEILSQIGE